MRVAVEELLLARDTAARLRVSQTMSGFAFGADLAVKLATTNAFDGEDRAFERRCCGEAAATTSDAPLQCRHESERSFGAIETSL